MKIDIVKPADHIDLLMRTHNFRVDVRGIYPTLIRTSGLQEGQEACATWKCDSYQAARSLAMRLMAESIVESKD